MAFENKLIHLFGDETTFKHYYTNYLTLPVKKITCETEPGRRRIILWYDDEEYIWFWYYTNLFAEHSEKQEFKISEGKQLLGMAVTETEQGPWLDFIIAGGG